MNITSGATLKASAAAAAAGIAAASLLGLAGCATTDTADVAPADETALQLLTSYLTGSFSSAAQAAEDERFFDIRLETVRIWPERDDGVWLYVEQAAAPSLDQPYRQRVYRLSVEGPGLYRSRVYTFGDPSRVAGLWRTPAAFEETLSPRELELREGCAIHLTLEQRGVEQVFVGGTNGTDCESSLQGAAYATSEVVLRPDELLTWDRGYDAGGQQVWGAKAGPYRFERVGG